MHKGTTRTCTLEHARKSQISISVGMLRARTAELRVEALDQKQVPRRVNFLHRALPTAYHCVLFLSPCSIKETDLICILLFLHHNGADWCPSRNILSWSNLYCKSILILAHQNHKKKNIYPYFRLLIFSHAHSLLWVLSSFFELSGAIAEEWRGIKLCL